ncbi:MAG: DegT/DnrJ/EryC1/StrS family aminotransferase [Coriobacteriales bacterium]|nr:DegT/DnrJ/EryC1/StrS family aminotransferase [Coriobacteriales bacterium]
MAKNEIDVAAELRQRMADLTSTCVEDWYLVTKARQGMQTVLAAAGKALDRTEVITQLFTCVTAINPILAAGLTPHYVDISEKTLCLSAEDLYIDESTAAVIHTNTFGIIDPATSFELRRVAHEAGALLIEDSAHCVGRMARDDKSVPMADVSIHSFGVEKLLFGTYFGGAVWVNPEAENTEAAQAIREALDALPIVDAQLDKAARSYRNQMRVLTRLPQSIAGGLRERWEGSGSLEPAVSEIERRGGTNHEPSKPSAWMCSQALAALESVTTNKKNRRACVRAYLDNFSAQELEELKVPKAALRPDSQALLRFPIFVEDEAQADALAEAIATLGFYVPAWPRPLLVPGVLDPEPYGLAEGTDAWPVSERLSAGVVALPTDIDPAQVGIVVQVVRDTLGVASEEVPEQEAPELDQTTQDSAPELDVQLKPVVGFPKNLKLIRGRENLAERLQPVVCGADILGYSYVRCYHEAYGIRPIVLSAIDVKVTSSSKFCDYRIVPELNDEDGFVRAISQLGAELEAQGKVGILHGSADWNTRVISAHKDEFSQWYVVPYIDFALLDSITQKERFYELCEELDIAYPKTWYVDCADETQEVDVHEFPYPLIAKPSNSAAYDLLSFEGKEKIYEIETPERLADVIRIVRGSGYAHKLILQDFVPGGDDAIRSLTTFSDADGNVRVVSGGQVVLQDHSPLALGNPVCIMGEKVDKIVEDAAKFLKHVGYHGYANLDIKYDSRDGSYRFFEINTRPGKNTFYVSLGGMNFVVPIVEDWVLGNEIPYTEAYEPFLYTVVPPKVVEMSVTDEELRNKALDMFRARQAHNPHDYAPDSLVHKAWAEVVYRHQVSKFKAYL